MCIPGTGGAQCPLAVTIGCVVCCNRLVRTNSAGYASGPLLDASIYGAANILHVQSLYSQPVIGLYLSLYVDETPHVVVNLSLSGTPRIVPFNGTTVAQL